MPGSPTLDELTFTRVHTLGGAWTAVPTPAAAELAVALTIDPIDGIGLGAITVAQDRWDRRCLCPVCREMAGRCRIGRGVRE
ncbi:hypothetical protein [Nocardia aurantiaca]|uniref:Uncharacterized protein n=1 Tax=Nocardia aurantiaca TaxID=2675850 RepID=A0A6I3L9K5_9NOCA|nr:hypothetical protein [Nocardia aurantiaca]MTE17464.1 hypothetical protein [Nocardia aurantiaca]